MAARGSFEQEAPGKGGGNAAGGGISKIMIAGIVGVVVVVGVVAAVAMGGSGAAAVAEGMTTTAPVKAGDKTIPGDFKTAGFLIGEDVTIGAGTATEEDNQIAAFGSMILKNPLKFAHDAGTLISTRSTPSGPTAPTIVSTTTTVTTLGPTTTVTYTRLSAIKGVSYGPTPLKLANTKVPNDDFWNDHAKTLWGPKAEGNRGDLEIIKAMGANTVRLYGNDPRKPHGPFLEYATEIGLQVVIGMSDYPYIQSEVPCVPTAHDISNWENKKKPHKDCNCFTDLQEQATMMLKGFTGAAKSSISPTQHTYGTYNTGLLKTCNADGCQAENHYHQALENIILINEPELKIIKNGTKGYRKAVVSALDGFLSAEKALGVTGHKPTFTATMSFGIERHPLNPTDQNPAGRPGLGQMLSLEEAMLDPSKVNYVPTNDVAKAYRERFINSFNTANRAADMKPQFLDAYQEHFGTQPVFIGEFHTPHSTVSKELSDVLAIVEDTSNSLSGISFFEFQVRYDKGGHEMDFGMFGLGNEKIGAITLDAQEEKHQEYDVYCLTQQEDHGETMAAGLTKAFGGPGVPASHLCQAGIVEEM